ncbi:MAG: VanW family protein [Eubacterium sp.]|nr:VanW family protein [Eubacterium sp.]
MRKKIIGSKIIASVLAASLVLTLAPFRVRAEQGTATDSTLDASLENNVIRDNIFINGQSVGGLSYSKALELFGGDLDGLESVPVTLTSSYGDINTSLGDLGISDNTREVVEEALQYGNSGNVLQRFRDRELLKTESVDFTSKRTVNSNIIKQMVDSNLGHAMTGVNKYNLNHNEDGTVTVTAEGDSVSVDPVKTESAVEEIINKEGYSKEPVTTGIVIADNAENERIKQLAKITDQLGTYTTSYASSSGARKTNVQRAASLVDGHVLYPGEQISVYNCIAPIDVSNGYELAHAYVGTEVVDSPGGGVCQVATTLYNAVLRAELNVIQRNCHSMKVSYVPISADAAIAGGVLDLKFSNNLDAPIYIAAGYDGGNLTFSIYGQEYRPSNRTIEFESVQTGVINPSSEPIYTEDKSLEPGTEQVTSPAITGYTGELWKHIYVDGVETEKVKINSSKYQASPPRISVNSDEPDDSEEDEDDNAAPDDGEKKKKKKKKQEEEQQEPVDEPEDDTTEEAPPEDTPVEPEPPVEPDPGEGDEPSE